MDDRTFALLLALALVVFTLSPSASGRKRRQLTAFHNLSWAMALTLYASGLVNYTNITMTAWLLITGAILSFNVGVLVPLSLARGLRLTSAGPPSPRPL